MKRHTIIILVIAAVFLVLMAVRTSKTPAPPSMQLTGRKIFPELPDNAISVIKITNNDFTIEVQKAGTEWISPPHYNHPADFGAIRKLVRKIADIEIGQEVYSDSEVRTRLRMYPPDNTEQTAASGTMIEFFDDEGHLLVALLAGRQRMTRAEENGRGGWPDGRYVSPDKGTTVYLSTDPLPEIPSTPDAWLEKDILDVNQSIISKFELQTADGDKTVLEKIDGNFEVAGLADDEETDSSNLFSIKSALSQLRLDGVANPALSDADLGLEKPAVFKAFTDDDLIYTVKLGKQPDNSSKWYARFSVEAAIASEPADEKTEKETSAEEQQEDAEKMQTVKALNERLARWTYIIPEYKASAMTRERSDLVKEKEVDEEE